MCPEWTALVEGLRPNQLGRDEVDPADHCHGWQFFAAQRVEHHFRAETVWPRLTLEVTVGTHVRCCVLCRSFFTAQSPCAAALPHASALPFLASPPSHFSHLPVWPTTRSSWPPPCSVFESRSVGLSVFFVESAAARACRKAGARVSRNLFVRDLDLPVAPHDARRLEVAADGLPCLSLGGQGQKKRHFSKKKARKGGAPKGGAEGLCPEGWAELSRFFFRLPFPLSLFVFLSLWRSRGSVAAGRGHGALELREEGRSEGGFEGGSKGGFEGWERGVGVEGRGGFEGFFFFREGVASKGNFEGGFEAPFKAPFVPMKVLRSTPSSTLHFPRRSDEAPLLSPPPP